MTKRVVIVDADIWAFKCSAAAETRSIKVTHAPTKLEKSFKHRTEFKQLMQSKSKEITADYVVEDVQTPEPLSYCLNTIKHKFNNLKQELEADEIVLYCGDEWNFRLELPLPSKYKGQRSNSLRPLHLLEAKKYITNVLKAEQAIGHEVDDAVCIRAYEELNKGNIAVIHSIDKDSYSHNGVYIHNPDIPELVLIPELGELYLDKNKKVKGKGLMFLCHQLLYGDRVDNFCPYELSDTYFGEQSSYNKLVKLKSVQDCLITVKDQYKEFYPDEFKYKAWDGTEHEADWKSMLELYFKCAWMKRSTEDTCDASELFSKYGVDL